MPNSTNSQMLDAVIQTSESVLANSPTVALSMFYQAAGQAYSLTMQNASSNQQTLNSLNVPIVSNAVTAITLAGKK